MTDTTATCECKSACIVTTVYVKLFYLSVWYICILHTAWDTNRKSPVIN